MSFARFFDIFEENTKRTVIFAASKILDYLDDTVEPCDDFYNFACGKFVKESIIPDDKSTLTAFSVISDKLQEQLRMVIEEPVQQSDARPFQLAKNLYRACMNRSECYSDDNSFNVILRTMSISSVFIYSVTRVLFYSWVYQ